MVRLTDWEVLRSQDSWLAPEQRGLHLSGNVEGHPKFPDGAHVYTSMVASFKGRKITTESGTEYLLGDPSPEYREWLRVNRPNWDPEEPFTLLERHEVR